MTTFVTGQRWISETELDQGLGTVLALENRRVTIFYSSTGETRLYQLANSPLHRIVFSQGDVISSHEGWSLQITGLSENEGIITYKGIRQDTNAVCELQEFSIDGQITFTRPRQRMLAGQLGKNNEFNLRYTALKYYQEILQSPLLGLRGNRVTLIPHQLHIAREAGDRFFPRVLLADEVGLGKTIEAGLILNRQLLTGRIQRVLIVVPEPLIHQWLVEMLRRFNLQFNIFNKALYSEQAAENPFDSVQLVLTSMEFLCSDEQYMTQVTASQWDMVIIDEAHHLQWSLEEGGSREYNLVESLAGKAPALLLLTATPEQSGREGHFARLRLLDPACFHSLDDFHRQEAHYGSIVKLAQKLLQDEVIDTATMQQCRDILGSDVDEILVKLQDKLLSKKERRSIHLQIIDNFLDRYGISRLFFRNTREGIPGFPGRVSQGYMHTAPELYMLAAENIDNIEDMLFPEMVYQRNISSKIEDSDPWWQIDPRVEWLDNLLRLINDKVLIICANASTAVDLQNSVRILSGQHAAVFHEEMSIIERDRAAAWFSDEEYGASALICSEIGSEGRNFQFAHHLVLFDLPFNPDLLEQRIGRLDRIGQKEIIKIHIPCFRDTPQSRLFMWYNEGINAFDKCCPAASQVFAEQKEMLSSWVFTGKEDDKTVINMARELAKQINRQLHEGRDTLIELSSRGKDTTSLKTNILADDQPDKTQAFLESLFDCFGVETGEHSPNCLIASPGDHMPTGYYPSLPEEGATITFDREKSLKREDMHFISWEHPMVREGIEMLINSDIGNTAVSLLKNRTIAPGTLMLEAVFVVETTGAKALNLNTLLPPTVIHTLIDPEMKDLSEKIDISTLHRQLIKVKKSQGRVLIQSERDTIQKMIQRSEEQAHLKSQKIIRKACEKFQQQISMDITRLETLKTVNPNIRDDEIEFLKTRQKSGQSALEKAALKLDAVRVIVTMH